VKAAVERKRVNIEYVRMCLQDRDIWRRVVHFKARWAACVSLTLGLVL
jgi:hypothetical protein